MSTRPKKDRSASNADPDGDVAPKRKARTVRVGEASARQKKKRSGEQPRVVRRHDPSASMWTPAIVAVPVGLIALFAIVFMLLVNSSTSAPPPPSTEEAAPAPPPRPVVLDPEPAPPAPVAAPKPEPGSPPQTEPATPSADDAPPIEGDE